MGQGPSWARGGGGRPWGTATGTLAATGGVRTGRGGRLQPTGSLKADGGVQSFQAALQTQWSWMLQLCCCIETHLKENTAYFQVRTGSSRVSCGVPEGPQTAAGGAGPLPVSIWRGRSRVGAVLPGSRQNPLQPEAPGPRVTLLPSQFFSDVRETEEQLRKLQETLRRKYTCDRSVTVTRLEDLLQDAQVRPRPARAMSGATGRWPSPSGMQRPGGGSCGGGGAGPSPWEPGEAGSESVLHGCFVRAPVGVGVQQWGGDWGAGGKTRRGRSAAWDGAVGALRG